MIVLNKTLSGYSFRYSDLMETMTSIRIVSQIQIPKGENYTVLWRSFTFF